MTEMIMLFIILGGTLFFFNKGYILLSLMMMEFISVSGIFFYVSIFELINLNYWLLLYVLVFLVCDAALGLSLLIFLVRSFGHNFMSLLYMSI